MVLACLVAGLLPVGIVVFADLSPGSVDDSAYGIAALIGPPLVGLAFVPRLRWRALWVPLGGFLTELLILVAIAVALSRANWSLCS